MHSSGELTNTCHCIRSSCFLGFALLALPTLPVEDSGFLILAVPLWFQDLSLVPPPVKPACYLPGSARDWELPEQGSERSCQNTGTYYSHNSIKCPVSTEQETRKRIPSSLISFHDKQCVTGTNRNYALQRAIQFSKQITHLKMYPLSDQLAVGLNFRESRILVYKETNVPQLAITLVLAQQRRFYLPSCKHDCSKTQNADVTASSCLASIQ